MPISSSMGARLMYQHETIRELTAGLPVTMLKYRAHFEKWSIFENIAHLGAYQFVFARRLYAIQHEDSPVFERYVAENDPFFPNYLAMTPPALLADIDEKRTGIFTTLEDGGKALLVRTGSHPRYGLLTAREWTEFFLLHEAHHLYTIFQLLRDLIWDK